MSFLRPALLSIAVLPFVALAEAPADRATANAHFQAADARVKETGATLEAASKAFRGCRNGALQFQFTDALGRLEKSRRALEKGRKEAQAFRRSLEATRAKLEVGHSKRNAPTRQEAVANEQVYAERLATEYVAPLDGVLVPLIGEYTSGLNAYSAALTRYAEFCAKPGYTAAGGVAFVASMEPELVALASAAAHLVTAAGQGRAVSSK